MSSVSAYPTTVVNDTIGGSPTPVTWTSPGNAAGPPDGSFATVTVGMDVGGTGFPQKSQGLKATGLGTPVPGGSTIVGIEVAVSRKAGASNTAADATIALLRAGSRDSGTIKTLSSSSGIPTALTAITFGSPTDKWGVSWSEADINAAGFGADYQCQIADESINPDDTSGVVSVDSIQVTVYYTASGGAGAGTAAGSSTAAGVGRSIAASAGSSSGSSSASAGGAAIASAAGVTEVSAFPGLSLAIASGASIASAAGTVIAEGRSNAEGAATFSGSPVSPTGIANGSSAATGASAIIATGAGTANGDSSANATAPTPGAGLFKWMPATCAGCCGAPKPTNGCACCPGCIPNVLFQTVGPGSGNPLSTDCTGPTAVAGTFTYASSAPPGWGLGTLSPLTASNLNGWFNPTIYTYNDPLGGTIKFQLMFREDITCILHVNWATQTTGITSYLPPGLLFGPTGDQFNIVDGFVPTSLTPRFVNHCSPFLMYNTAFVLCLTLTG